MRLGTMGWLEHDIDQALEQSFPASDPPPWTLGEDYKFSNPSNKGRKLYKTQNNLPDKARFYRYQALAVDYDGTLAHDGRVDSKTLAALERIRASERTLILVTGRRLEDVKRIFPPIGLFDLVVAENGALLYWPTNNQIKLLAEPPLPVFVQALRSRRIATVFSIERKNCL